jgi:hypothetical protein
MRKDKYNFWINNKFRQTTKSNGLERLKKEAGLYLNFMEREGGKQQKNYIFSIV